ncbi:hypothetical protein N473_06815 [Pseudoalteromonas luteoviolacea CPMOR-1]|uniref:Uncharacterized protein n=1 Tax=Pseudoalteromonas luteoviolacea CPMOR-1 TaxID=1365248 RepID=A0A167H3H7_9GAMM|nr:hypothetical protein N473_06815 [Pseudoalteromonas luteoviolacea CPMOR-1]
MNRFNRTDSIHLYKLSNRLKTNKAWILKRVQDDVVQKVSDSERSECAFFAQGEVSRFNRTESIHLYKFSNRVKTNKAWILKRVQDDVFKP